MKYVNSLKYMNSFDEAGSLSDVSQKRMRELCASLGRINIGTNSIFLPTGTAGHAAAVMLESVIKSAGYKVGRITSVGGYDSRSIVFLDGEIPEIEAYNRAVSELKAAIIKAGDEKFLKEEVCFALALLLCKMYGCEYIIFEGTSGCDHSIDSICAPYDLVVIPTVHDENEVITRIACDAIKRGVREVISGNQKKNIYDMISNVCVTCGVRLNFTSKLGFKVESLSSIKLSFSYGGRDGYTIKSPSLLQRDCAMLVIESALAIRRDGVKLPWASISTGLAAATGTGCFELLSVSPLMIVDSAESSSETELLISTLEEVLGDGKPDNLTVCIPSDAIELLNMFEGRNLLSYIIIGEAYCELPEGAIVCRDFCDGAKKIVSFMRDGRDILCFGSVDFALKMKIETVKHMNG